MKLFLHICCAPCAVAIVDRLKGDSRLELGGCYFNPNIHPEEENSRRKQPVEALAAEFSLPVHFNDACQLTYWKSKLAEDKHFRCGYCYAGRMDYAAALAAQKGYEAFTTSLLISPYQDQGRIVERGRAAANKYGIAFYYEDFRPLYRKGREMARARGWYMQKYCGCYFSYLESDHPKKPVYAFDTEEGVNPASGSSEQTG